MVALQESARYHGIGLSPESPSCLRFELIVKAEQHLSSVSRSRARGIHDGQLMADFDRHSDGGSGNRFDLASERGRGVIDRIAGRVADAVGCDAPLRKEPRSVVNLPKIPGCEIRGLLGRGWNAWLLSRCCRFLQRCSPIWWLDLNVKFQPSDDWTTRLSSLPTTPTSRAVRTTC